KRWTASRKKEICDSRVKSGRLLTSAIQKLSKCPVSFISASAIGWYGADASTPAIPFREEAPYDRSFLGETCRQWEDSIQELPAMDIRTVILRIGIVLSRKGGALPEFIKPLRLGVAPILGSGKQVISWIQLEDLVAMIVFAMEQPRLSGVYNAVAPAPATQQQLMHTLAQLTKRFFIPVPVPSWILQAVMGEMSIEVLKSTTVSADKILATGFSFRYPMLREALAAS
ncbi:MAG: TIGR01777 family oxidoreductase, partial [Bacteroidetes bacterium]|nr:TIGR01777 family oxidoreductase [Bacteroidota bacterium]